MRFDEAGRALEQQKLIPITLDETKPPLGFGAYQMLSMSSQEPDASALIQILDDDFQDLEVSEDGNSGGIPIQRKWKKGFAISLLSILVVAALERVRAATRSTIEVVSAFHSNAYHECLSGKSPRRHLTFQAIELRSRTLDTAQLAEEFRKLKQAGDFAGSIQTGENTLVLEIYN